VVKWVVRSICVMFERMDEAPWCFVPWPDSLAHVMN
jgi:hypothetical protein